jgi:hypothetical protein
LLPSLDKPLYFNDFINKLILLVLSKLLLMLPLNITLTNGHCSYRTDASL